ncbi:VOC family protein [Aliikangiella sp. IMCC44359]|uniref:VOC family protein n=1 Tax=Aliikangiella sp. IMCC44359 TaxID=3459125 RepID=UPI00403AAF9F
MKHIVTWAEIPVTNLERAMNFYRETLSFNFKREEMCGYEYAMFETEEEAVTGALVFGKGFIPSNKGSIIYLDGGDDLNIPLGKIENMGNKIVIPKTGINEGEHGYFAHFIDSEGNIVGLYSKK